MSEFHDLDRRATVLEQIAADTRDTLREMHTDIRELRAEIRELRADMREFHSDVNRQFRWLVGLWIGSLGAVLAVMAHGFHWL